MIPPGSICGYEKCETRDTALEKGSAWRLNEIDGADFPESYVHDQCRTAAHEEEKKLLERDFELLTGMQGTFISGPEDGSTATFLFDIPEGSSPEEALRAAFGHIEVHGDPLEGPDNADVGA